MRHLIKSLFMTLVVTAGAVLAMLILLNHSFFDARVNTLTFWCIVVLLVINLFVRTHILYWLALLLLFYSYYRMFSRNYSRRYAENQKFLSWRRRLHLNPSRWKRESSPGPAVPNVIMRKTASAATPWPTPNRSGAKRRRRRTDTSRIRACISPT